MVTVRAPATSANLGSGYDVFGVALDRPADVIRVEAADETTISVTGVGSRYVPTDPERNVAGVVAGALDAPARIEIDKGVRTASGLGSSAASAAGTALALNELYDLGHSRRELVPVAAEGEAAVAGEPHADNVAPALLGGFTVVTRGTAPTGGGAPTGSASTGSTPTGGGASTGADGAGGDADGAGGDTDGAGGGADDDGGGADSTTTGDGDSADGHDPADGDGDGQGDTAAVDEDADGDGDTAGNADGDGDDDTAALRVLRVDADVPLVACLPGLAVSTRDAREAVPESASVDALVDTVGRAATLTVGMHRSDPVLVGRGMADGVVTPARADLVEGYDDARAAALGAGATGATISGAGPSVLAACRPGDRRAVAAAMVGAFEAAGVDARAYRTEVGEGATVYP